MRGDVATSSNCADDCIDGVAEPGERGVDGRDGGSIIPVVDVRSIIRNVAEKCVDG